MAEFYSAEVKRLKLLISLACTDLSMCLALLKGDIEVGLTVRFVSVEFLQEGHKKSFLHAQCTTNSCVWLLSF